MIKFCVYNIDTVHCSEGHYLRFAPDSVQDLCGLDYLSLFKPTREINVYFSENRPVVWVWMRHYLTANYGIHVFLSVVWTLFQGSGGDTGSSPVINHFPCLGFVGVSSRDIPDPWNSASGVFTS